MTVFNQQGQHVTNQYNASGDMHFGQPRQVSELITQIQSLMAMIDQHVIAGTMDSTTGNEAKEVLQQAAEEARKPGRKKSTLIKILTSAEEIMKGVTAAGGIAECTKQVIQYISRIFV